ncbi:hypothetical protein EVAR_83166_1 [Eumeta japonica]|uniref:Uncharacterized protein n=1 Tax=Eumeta variegata TaxID=151549 RepID=A0A4C1Y9I5_EUMVA|nr:hypothetical protein EVAR_83166_1 [Eumeta japonica]
MGHQALSKAPEMYKRTSCTYLLADAPTATRMSVSAVTVELPFVKPCCSPDTESSISRHDEPSLLPNAREYPFSDTLFIHLIHLCSYSFLCLFHNSRGDPIDTRTGIGHLSYDSPQTPSPDGRSRSAGGRSKCRYPDLAMTDGIGSVIVIGKQRAEQCPYRVVNVTRDILTEAYAIYYVARCFGAPGRRSIS